jgi:uncharacterized protein YutE (UPF0331/DUF86 family)
MVEVAIVLRKVAELRRYTADVRVRVQVDSTRFEADEELHDLAGFHLMLALQNAVDLAFHLVADQGRGVPGSQREAFEVLAREGTIDAGLARALAEAASLRNRIAHQYGTLDWRRLLIEAPRHLDALERFAARVAELTP